MHITQLSSTTISHYLTAFFIKWSGNQWYDTTQLAIVTLKHFGVKDHDANQLKLFKIRLRKVLRKMMESNIIMRRTYENELKNVRYQYKYNENVWQLKDSE